MSSALATAKAAWEEKNRQKRQRLAPELEGPNPTVTSAAEITTQSQPLVIEEVTHPVSIPAMQPISTNPDGL